MTWLQEVKSDAGARPDIPVLIPLIPFRATGKPVPEASPFLTYHIHGDTAMSMGLALALGLTTNTAPSVAAPVAGTSPTTFTSTPTVHYHPNSQSATLDGSSRVLSCPDIMGLAPAIGNAAIAGNKIRNPNMAGAVAGTPGTLPTNWSIGGAAGLTTSVVASGVQNGLAYVDLRFVGTTSGTFATVLMDAAGIIAAANGQAWSGSATVSVVAGSLSNITSVALTTNVLDGASAVLQQLSTIISPTATPTRFSNSGTISNASAAFVRPLLGLNYSSGVAIDVTLRIAYPMLEQAAAASALQAIGPVQMTDGWGRKFWRFSSGQYMLINNALNALNMRQMMVFAVWRVAKVTRGTDFALLSLRYSAYTDDTTNTAQTNGYILRGNAATSTSEAARLKSGTVDSYANGIGGHFIPGAQIHVAGFNSRTTANGGGRFYINERTNDVAQTSLTATNGTGMIIGGKAATSNAVTGTTDNCYDLYELAIWKGTYTNAQSDTASAEMVANWGIQAITGQIIMTGDSITECIDTSSTVVIPQDGIAHKLAAPGAGYIPANFRVINIGIAGSALDTYAGAITGVDLDTQRDDTSSGFQMVYSGGAANNIVTVNIGINDMRSSVGNQTAAQHYARFVTLLNTGTTGYLQRGFKVVAVTPTSISGDATGQSRISAFRDLLINPTTDVIVSQFLTDVLANVGQTYDGLVSVLPIAKIQYASSGTIFADATDAGDTTYYATDGTHHTPLAMTLMVEGGSTPTYGYGPFLQAM